jgi:spermidine synthase
VLTHDYWDEFLVDPFAARPEPPRRVAILGFGAGTTATAYARYFPRTRVDGVEIDGELFDIGRRFFGLRARPQLSLHAEDARPFLARMHARYDAIFVDAYRQPYIPFYLTTREFFRLARERLTPGGVVVINVGHPEGSNQLERVLTATLRTAFPHVVRDPVRSTNTMLIASPAPIGRDALLRAAARLPADLRPIARDAAHRLAPGLPGGTVFTDDLAPVEWLVDGSIVKYAESRAR